jgi:tetratricopeptide (TPR) repeat protein
LNRIYERKNDKFFDICTIVVILQAPWNKYRSSFVPPTFVVVVLLCLCPFNAVIAQDDLNIHGVVSDAMSSSKLTDVEVSVIKDGKQIDKFSTRANGKYEFYLSCGAHYLFYFEKAGFVKRSIEIDSRGIPEEVIGAGIIMPTDMSMFAITPAMEDADLSVFDKPIGKATYNASEADLVWDFTYTQKVKGEINSFIRNLEKNKKAESPEDIAKAAAEAKFASLVQAGDDAMVRENFEEAVSNYRSALEIKPDAQNVKAKLGDAETKLNQKKEAERRQKAYDDAIAAGDAAFKADNFDQSIAKYEAALLEKPKEEYPKKRIAEAKLIKTERAEELAKKAEYDKHMAEGQTALNAQIYDGAIAAFDKAIAVLPGDKEAQKKRDDATELLKSQQENAARDAQYASLIKKADELFAKQDFAQAKVSYAGALEVKDKDPYASERLQTCDLKIKELADKVARQKEFDALVIQGDEALLASNYQLAITNFSAALAIFADEAAVKSKLEQAQALLAEEEAEKQKKERYDKLITDADKAFGKEDFSTAQSLYTQAREVDSAPTYPLDQLNKIKAILNEKAEEAAIQEAYDKAMTDARESVKNQAYDKALSSFDQALKAIPKDATATEEKNAAAKLKTDFEAKLALDEAYEKAIAEASNLKKEDKLKAAIERFEAALSLKPAESYPQQQIDEIKALMGQREAQQAEAEKQAAIQKEFDEAMAAGELAMSKKDFQQAISQFEAALSILPDAPLAIQKKMDAEEALKAFKATQAVDEQYTTAIVRGDSKFAEKAYSEARKAYEEALGLKPNEGHPKTQIALIDEAIEAQEAAAADAELQAQNEKVNVLALEGDQLVGKNQFNDGIGKYQQALAILPSRTDVQRKLEAAEVAQQKWLEAQATDEAYSAIIAKADAAFKSKDWDPASNQYREALEIKSEDPYPAAQLELIAQNKKAETDAALAAKSKEVADLVAAGDKLLAKNEFADALDAYREALSVLPERADVQTKIADAESAELTWMESQATDDAYAATIQKADKAFAASDWSTATSSYEKALEIKANEAYPKEQLAQIEAKIKAQAAAKQAEIDSFIKAGDKSMADKDYEGAILSYENALDLDPSRSDVEDKVAEAQRLMEMAMDAEAQAAAYQEVIAEGDKALAKSKLEDAKSSYQRALGLRPDEKYPKDKLAEIQAAFDAAARQSSEQEAMAKQKAFDDLIEDGDNQFGKQAYESAISIYESALVLKPESETAQSKLDAARKALNEIDAFAAKNRDYNEAISEADDFFRTADYEMSKMRYEDALAINPAEKYPSRRIAEINKILDKQLLKTEMEALAVKEEKYAAAIKRADAMMNAKEYSEAITAYKEALEIKSDEAYPMGQIERANLLITDRQSEQERLAAEKEAAERRKKQKEDDFRTVSSKSEEQAAAFMRDALLAQEREKYERIKKQKVDNSERLVDYGEEAELRRMIFYAELLGYDEVAKEIAETGTARYEVRARKSQGYKSTLLQNMQKQAQTARIREQVAYKQIQDDAQGLRDIKYKRHAEDLEQLREVAKEMQLFTEEYATYYRKKNDAQVIEGAKRVQRETEAFETQLDERKVLADAQRSKNLEEAYAKMQGDAKNHTEYFRMALALEYPQGVSEESSTLGNKVIITRIVVKGSKGDEFRKVLDRAGNYYFKNGQSISEITWNRETLDAFYRKD